MNRRLLRRVQIVGNSKGGVGKLNRLLVSMGFSIILVVGLIGLLGCGVQSPEEKYEKAKIEAEQKIAELEEIMIPLRAMERGDFSALPADPDELKRLSEKMKPANIQKLANEISQATLKVRQLMPPGYDDDYEQWTQQMKERLEAIK
jgi:hypothetical protein